VFDQPLLLESEALKLETAFQKRLIPYNGLQLEPATKVGQVEVQIYPIAGMHLSR
jgi:hypothetical protein